jgi:hypothetical protein
VEDRLFQRACRAGVYVVRRECRLRLGGFCDRFLEIAAVGRAAVHDAGLVEMDVGLDEAGRHQSVAEIDCLGVPGKLALDRDDASVGNADVGRLVLGVYKAGVFEDRSIERSPVSFQFRWRNPVLTEIGGHQRCVAGDVLRGSGATDRSGLQHVGAVGNGEREHRHLINQENGGAPSRSAATRS